MSKKDDGSISMSDLAELVKREVFDELDNTKKIEDSPEIIAWKEREFLYSVIQKEVEKKRKEFLDGELDDCKTFGTTPDWEYYNKISWHRLLLEEYSEIVGHIQKETHADETVILEVVCKKVGWRDRKIFSMLLEKQLKYKVAFLNKEISKADIKINKVEKINNSRRGGKLSVYDDAVSELEKSKKLYLSVRENFCKRGAKKQFYIDVRNIFKGFLGDLDVSQNTSKPDDKTIRDWIKEWEKECGNK